MQFAAPVLLWGALAMAIPVIIHLLNRERVQTVEFPSVRFMRRAVKVSATRSVVKQLILLAMRLLALLALAVALAGPRAGGSLFGAGSGRTVDAVILIDDSYTMAYTGSAGVRFERAKQVAEQIVEEMEPGSRVSLFAASGSPEPFSPNLPAVAGRIAGLPVAQRSVDLAEAIARAGSILEAAQGQPGANRVREIFLITDMIGTLGDASGAIRLPPSVVLYVRDVGEAANGNLFIENFSVEPLRFGVNSTVFLKADLRSVDSGPSAEVEATLEINGKMVAKGIFEVGEEVQFEQTFKEPGVVSGAIHIVSDNLLLDNRVYFSILMSERPRLLMVAAKKADGTFSKRVSVATLTFSPYKEEARQWVETKLVSSEQFEARSVSPLSDQYDAIVLLDVSHLSPATWRRLAGFLEQGGGLISFLGPHVDPANYNEYAAGECLPVNKIMLGRVIAQDKGPKAEGGGRLLLNLPDEALFAKIKGPMLDLTEPSFAFACPVVKTDAARVLASFPVDGQPAAGLPWLLEQPFGAGRSVLLTSGWTKGWNELYGGSHKALAFTFQHELLKYVKHGVGLLQSVEPGTPIDLREQINVTGGIDLYPPDSATPVKLETGLFADTTKSGNYLLTERGVKNNRLYGFSVNLDTADSRMIRQTPDQLREAFPEEDRKRVWFSKTDEQMRADVAGVEQGTELYPYIMLFLLALLSTESFFANRFYKR